MTRILRLFQGSSHALNLGFVQQMSDVVAIRRGFQYACRPVQRIISPLGEQIEGIDDTSLCILEKSRFNRVSVQAGQVVCYRYPPTLTARLWESALWPVPHDCCCFDAF